MRKDVKKAVSWIEKFEQKANDEVARIEKVDEGIETEISDLKVEITDLERNQNILLDAKKKIDNLRKALNGN